MLRESPAMSMTETDEVVSQPSAAANDALLLLERDGRLTPEDVVHAASDRSSPLHGLFEWDDKKAAHSHRLTQARRLIRGVRVVVTVEQQEVAMPRYVRDLDVPANHQGYVATDRLRDDPDKAKRLARHEFDRAAAHVQRAITVTEGLGEQAIARRVAAAIKKAADALA